MTEKEVAAWYNSHHASMGESAWRPRDAYHIFLDYLQTIPSKKLLDIGCGTGYLLAEASARGLETYGLDISREAVSISRDISSKSEIIVGSGEDIHFPDEYFDYITCLGVLEHFLDMNRGLKEIMRVAKKGARLCIMVPNSDFIYWKLRRRKGTQQRSVKETLCTLEEWKNLFEEAGLRIIEMRHDEYFIERSKKPQSASIRDIAKGVAMHILWALISVKHTYQIVFIMEKPLAANQRNRQFNAQR